MAGDPESPRVVLIDALGTLVTLRAPAPRLRSLLRQRFGVEVSEARAREALATEIAFYRANLQSGGDEPGLARLRSRCAEVLREALAAPAPLHAVSGADMTLLLLDSLEFTAFPEAPEALASLRGRGLRIAVVSNWDCSLPGVLERVGLSGQLEAVVSSAAFGRRKPDRRIFAHALDLLGAQSPHAVHIGDSLIEDVTGARAAGIRAILIQRGGLASREQPRLPAGVEVIGSLREVTLALDRERPSAPGA